MVQVDSCLYLGKETRTRKVYPDSMHPQAKMNVISCPPKYQKLEAQRKWLIISIGARLISKYSRHGICGSFDGKSDAKNVNIGFERLVSW